ncbi:MAG: hypothetical protein HY289_01055 [Planctomycetes bacterium]|nr:hypothetical protein [Planctomycetota bacterium]
MSWLLDNTMTFSILFGIIAAALVYAWYSTRRNVYLYGAGSAIALIVLLWALTRLIVTDARQLEDNVHAMAEAVMAGKTDDLFKHVSKDFRYHETTRDELNARARKQIEGRKVADIRITKFKVEEVSREKKFARTSFLASGSGEGFQFLYRVETDFILEGDAWKLKTMRFYNPLVNQDQEIRLPGI